MYNLTNCRINITADPEQAKASGEEIDRKRFVEEFSLLMTVKKTKAQERDKKLYDCRGN